MKKRDKLRRKSKGSLFKKLLLIICIVAGGLLVSSTDYFDVETFEIEGNSYYSDQEVLVIGDCKPGGNIFWDVNFKDIKSRLEKDAYIESVKVKRQFPNGVYIEIKERKQIASLIYGNHYVVVDKEGRVLRNTEVNPYITEIRGLTITKIEVGQLIEVEEKVKLRQSLEVLSAMDSNDMYFTKIEFTNSGVEAYVLENLKCEGTPQNIIKALQAGDLQRVIVGLFKQDIQRGTVKISGGDYISFSPEI